MIDKNIKIIKPSGEAEYKVITAFNDLLILDSKQKDANANTIVFVCKINNDILEVVEGQEWDLAKQNLIGVVKQTVNVNYIELQSQYTASENIGHPLALTDSHIKVLSDSYSIVKEEVVVEQPSIEPQVEISNVNENMVASEEPVAMTEEQIVPVQDINSFPTIESAPEAQAPVAQENIVIVEDPETEEVNAMNMLENQQIMENSISTPEVAPVTFEQPMVEPQAEVQNVVNPFDFQPVIEDPIDLITPAPIAMEQTSLEPQVDVQSAVNPFDYQPVNQETSSVDLTEIAPVEFEQPAQEVDASIENDTIAELKALIVDLSNKIVSLEQRIMTQDQLQQKQDSLSVREQNILEKEANIDAKLVVANKAFENSQAIVNMNDQGQVRTLAA